jgi:hypothetical protein
MSTDVVSPLRQRMTESKAARKLSAGTQTLHINSCKRFTAFSKTHLMPSPSRTSAASS